SGSWSGVRSGRFERSEPVPVFTAIVPLYQDVLSPAPLSRGERASGCSSTAGSAFTPFLQGGRREAAGDSIKQKNAGLCPAFSLVFRRVSFTLAQQPVEDGALGFFNNDRLHGHGLRLIRRRAAAGFIRKGGGEDKETGYNREKYTFHAIFLHRGFGLP